MHSYIIFIGALSNSDYIQGMNDVYILPLKRIVPKNPEIIEKIFLDHEKNMAIHRQLLLNLKVFTFSSICLFVLI